ncbi:MAG: hypothetical protein M1831_004344 [Alyxoria varia]|nr:MAG: hypothetical protein M1831_004344 [Alyxoria varia]
MATGASVNRPTNSKVKEQDVNQKLQLYGIYSGFALGKVPSNKQIDVAMNSALASKPLAKPSSKLSSEGQELVSDLRDVIEKAKLLLLTKNEGNLIQDFIYQCTKVTTGDAKRPDVPVNKETAQQHGNEALEGLKTLGQLLISNGQFRKLLNDAFVLARDVATDGAQNAANRIRPSEEQISQIDRPADDNTWHENPDLSGAKLKDQLKSQYDKNKPFNKDEAKSAAQDSTLASAEGGSGAGTTTGVQNAQNLKDKASANVPEETKQKGREAFDKTKNYLGDKMPKERREQTIWRLKKMIVEIQGHQDYQRAIDTLLRLAETYQGHTKNVAGQSGDSVKGAHTDTGLKSAEADLKVLIERFANSTSMDDLFDSINQIYRDADQDPELKGWFKDLDRYIRACLKEQGYVMQDAANAEWDKIYEKGNFLLRERYRNHTNRVVDEVKFFADQFDHDHQNKAFADAMEKLFKDLGNDENGKPAFKKHLVKDLSSVILPAIFEHVRYVPIPRIEYSDNMADAVIENLIIEGDNLAPNVFEFSTDNYFRWGRKQLNNSNKNKVMMSVSGIQMDLRDVSYYIKKKQGFPSITDKGVMDIFLGGTGFSFKAAMETADKKDKNHFFKVNNVTVDVKNMKIKVKQSNYKLLFSIVKPLLLRVMKPILQKVISAQIKNNINQLDALAYDIDQNAKKAEKDAKNNPDQVANIYQRYFNAAQQRLQKGQQKTEEKTEDKKVNVAFTNHESIFKDISLPGGTSSKATEYKDLAIKGDKWESPVFNLGSAKETSSLPRVAEVTRKPHNVTPSTVRDGSGLQPNGTSAFSNQVNDAFGAQPKANLSLNQGGVTQ